MKVYSYQAAGLPDVRLLDVIVLDVIVLATAQQVASYKDTADGQ